jgi:phosphatidylglycerophosphate synthase
MIPSSLITCAPMTEILSGLARVRASYTPEKAWQEMSGELPAFLLYRPLSFLLTVPLLALGVPATFITCVCLAIALSLPALAFMMGERAWLAVSLLALVFHVLDCVDGNLARTRGTQGPFGAWLDGVADQAFWVGLLCALGLMVRASQDPVAPQGLTLALLCALLVTVGQRLRDQARALTGTRVEAALVRPSRLGFLDWLVILFGGLENLYAFAILVGGARQRLAAVLCGVAVYVAVVFLASLALSARALLQAHTR